MMASNKSNIMSFAWNSEEERPKKNYMLENYRNLKKMSAETSQNKKLNPLRAKFVPGVTQNDKYAHVTSKVAQFLKDRENWRGSLSASKRAIESKQSTIQEKDKDGRTRKSQWSKSVCDLRKDKTEKPVASSCSMTMMSNEKSEPRSRKCASSAAESVYNWRFMDESLPISSKNCTSSMNSDKVKPVQYHRVEYLPCDGICAEETVVNDDTGLDSARSSSSRTSRGCNTEETRIICEGSEKNHCVLEATCGTIGCSTVGSNCVQPVRRPDVACVNVGSNSGMNLSDLSKTPYNESSGTATHYGANVDLSNTHKATAFESDGSLKEGRNKKTFPQPPAGNFNTGKHAPGTVPRYLIQRKEELREEEEAKKQLQRPSSVPSGHVLLSESERLETLGTLKQNYDGLVQELNRIPITVDTIRVKEKRMDLEKQLCKLEEAIKIFSRSRVLVKMD